MITNDSLRSKIIGLHSFHYQTLQKLEEEYYESQFQENYFHKINDIIGPQFIYDQKGNILGLELPLNLSEKKRNLLLSYLWKIQFNRKFIEGFYEETKQNIAELQNELQDELKDEIEDVPVSYTHLTLPTNREV